MVGNYAYGAIGKKTPRRIRKLLVAQEYQCIKCKEHINNSGYFEHDDGLWCGICTIGETRS